jgi:TldD protein
MTNTYMAAGKYSHEEIVKSIKKGVYAKSFSGGQVDICSGDFVFSITEGYWIEKGKIDFPIKGATLIGNGPKILKDIIMVGNDLVFSDGKWTCGKEGQSVPVGVGMPTAKLSHITVGGTKNV